MPCPFEKRLDAATSSPSTTSAVILIPAYKPAEKLIGLISSLVEAGRSVVVVNDGSGPAFLRIFQALDQIPLVTVLGNAINLGKGAALKTGMNYILYEWPSALGVVTADADGQHHPEDILRAATLLEANTDSLVIGAREFSKDIPLRSWVGNTLTRGLVRLVMGQKLQDTQSGLRGIPARLLAELLRIPSNGYEFELDMLIMAKHQGKNILQFPIHTIYEDGNASSHFNPVFDSMKIYFVLFRFAIVSILTAAIDNLVFALTYWLTRNIALGQVAGRTMAALFNYGMARRAVFLSHEKHLVLVPRYILSVIANGLFTYALIYLIIRSLPVSVIPAKIIAESFLFLVNFAIQRDFVFMKKQNQSDVEATDWTDYYKSAPATAKITRQFTASALVDAFRNRAKVSPERPVSVIEIGGANSCFVDRIMRDVAPAEYHVVDTNEYGLNLLRERPGGGDKIHLHNQSVLDLHLPLQAEVVFSVGLIEHFDPERTRQAVHAHFDATRAGGHVILSFPNPTWLYRIARGVLETMGLWKFPDERPLSRAEVIAAIEERGQVLYERMLWPLVLTQLLIVVRKHGAPEPVMQRTQVNSPV